MPCGDCGSSPTLACTNSDCGGTGHGSLTPAPTHSWVGESRRSSVARSQKRFHSGSRSTSRSTLRISGAPLSTAPSRRKLSAPSRERV
eukprot:4302095-Prymnesium_polylepis.1